MRVQNYTADDIEKFVVETYAMTIDDLPDMEREAAQISDELILDIVGKAEGVFMWAKLVVAELVASIEAGGGGYSIRKVRQISFRP
jgi:hypothetical protein